jgi:hypothetical protein
LFHAPLTEDLEFHALSYTWGDLNHKQTIMVNDQPFQVNQNLYDFLDQIWRIADLSTHGEEVSDKSSLHDVFRREYLSMYGEEISVSPTTEALHWWIDAICINQDDVDEKSEQVPRMGQLYSSASQVWVWLGLPQTFSCDEFQFTTLELGLGKQSTRDLSDVGDRDGKIAVLASRLKKVISDISARIIARLILERMREDSRTSGSRNLTHMIMPEFQVVVEAVKAYVSENAIRERAGFPRVPGQEYALPIVPADPGDYIAQLLRDLNSLMTNPWFERTWVIQEFVLSRNSPIILLGDCPLDCFRLFDLGWCISHNPSTMSSATHAAYRSIENNLFKLFNLMKTYQCRRESGVSFETREFSLLSPAHKLLSLLKLFFDKQSTIPHDNVYGMLGLLDDPLPEYLKPDYKLPFERVCQDYARFIIEATQNLEVIEAHKSELKACPSWVPDFRYLTTMREFHTASTTGTVRFSADSQQLTVEGIPIGRVLDCSCNHPRANFPFGHLHLINDFILVGSARLTQCPVEAVFTTWLEIMLDEKFINPLDSISNIQTMESLISGFTTAREKLCSYSGIQSRPPNMLADCLASIEVFQVIMFLISFEYCLLETGEIAICKLKNSEPQTRHHEEDAVWALKGCEHMSVLRPGEGGYTYAGSCQVLQPGILRSGCGSSYQLDEEFFAGKQLEEVTLV